MRKKVIISIIIASVVAGGVIGGTKLYSAKTINDNKEIAAAAGKIVANKSAEECKEAESKCEEVIKEEQKTEEKKEKENKEKQENNNSTAANVKQENDKPKAQTLEEGYALCSKMWNAYNSENFDEAVRLYESITNKDAIAKIGTDKIRIYHGQNMNREIAKAQGYYNSGDYIKARTYIREVMGNLLLPNQKQRAETLYNNAKSKVSASDEKKANAAFTNEKAVQLIKEKMGCGPHDTFSDFSSYQDPYMGKTISCVLHKNGDQHNVVFYKVFMDGTVIEPD